MRLTGIEVDNYGPHRGLSIGPEQLSGGINVFLGPNARGKSALRAFLRMVLFNRVDGRQRSIAATFNYRHEDDGTGAGAIRLETADGAAYTVRRIEGSAAEVTGGTTGGDEVLRGLMGRIDASLYQDVFSISLTELNSISMESIGDRIYSAGFGLSVGLRGAIKRLEDEQSSSSGLWAPRSGRLREGLRMLNESRARLEAASAEMAGYESISADIAGAATEIANLDDRIRQARQRDVALDELLRLRQESRRVRTELADGDALAAGRKAERDSLPVSQALGAHSEAARRLIAEQQRYAGAVADRPGLQHQLDEALASVERQASRVGPGWDEDRIRTFDQVEPASRAIRESWSCVEAARNAVSASGTALEFAEQSAQEGSDKVSALSASREAMTGVPSESMDILEQRRDRLERLRAAVMERDALRLRVRSDSVTASGNAAWSTRSALVAGLAIVGVAEAIVAIVVGQPVAIAAGLAMVAGAGLLWLERRGQTTGGEAGDTLVAALDRAEGDVAALADELQYDAHLADSALVEAQNGLNRQLERRREFDRVCAEIAEGERGLARAHTGRDSAVQAAQVAADSLREAEAGWTEALQKFDLPEVEDDTSAISIIGQIETLKSDLREADSLRTRIAAIDRAIEEIETRLRPLIEEAGMPAFKPGDATAALADLQQVHEVHQSANTKSGEIEKQLAEWDSRRSVLQSTLEGQDAAIEEMALSLGLTHQPAEELQTDMLIAARPATAAPATPSLEAAIEAERRAVATHIEELEAGREAERNRRSELIQQQRLLEDANPVADLQGQIDELEQRVETDARRWAVLTVARQAIEDTKLKYQSERQAPLLQLASLHFREITGGQCDRVEALVDEEELRVIEANGRVKSIAELSRGTREQLYLSLRFALIDEYGQHAETLPVVMDDVMVNFDGERTRAACITALEFSRAHQVIYLTCDDRVAETFLREAESTDCPQPAVIQL